MRSTVLLLTGFGCLLATTLSAEETKKFSVVDLQPKANQKLADEFGLGQNPGNNLDSLARGERNFLEVKFKIADSLLQLRSPLLKDSKPDRVDGIQVGKALAKLHFLHATQLHLSGGLNVADDTEIAKYEVHYEGGDTATIPVVFGQDVRNWWYSPDEPGVTRGEVAWTGENEATRNRGMGRALRLYLNTWENPHPAKRVVSIDYVKVGDLPAAPFCVAMTVEEK